MEDLRKKTQDLESQISEKNQENQKIKEVYEEEIQTWKNKINESDKEIEQLKKELDSFNFKSIDSSLDKEKKEEGLGNSAE